MAIGKSIEKVLGGGALVFILGKGFEMVKEFAKSIVTDEFGKKAIKTAIDPKTWEDEGYFASALVIATLKPDQRKIIQDGIIFAEEQDSNNGTRYTKNFREILTFLDKKDATIAAAERPSVKIIQKMAEICKTKQEVLLFMQEVGATHDPFLTFERVMHIGKKDVWPFLKKNGTAITKAVASSAKGAATSVEKKLTERADEYKERSPWKKYLVN